MDEGVLAKAGVLRAWRAASGEAAADEEAAAGSSVGNRRPVEGDCPICFCSMEVRLLSALSARLLVYLLVLAPVVGTAGTVSIVSTLMCAFPIA